MQLANTARPVDHRPLVVDLPIVTLGYTGEKPRAKLDRDLLADCVLRARNRQPFFDRLACQLDETRCEHEVFLERGDTNSMYRLFLNDLSLAAEHVFATSCNIDPETRELGKRRERLLGDRREIRLGMSCSAVSSQSLSSLFKGWHIVSSLLRLSKMVRLASRAVFKRRVECCRLEILQAWRGRSLAKAWRASRSVSCTSKGAHRKWGRMPLTSSPSCEQFLEHVSRPGCDGGWLASPASDPLDFAKCDLGPDSPFWREAVNDASRDFLEIKRLARTSQLRKGVPKWEVPAELWRLILHPDKVVSVLPFGLGHNRKYERPTEATSRVIQMLSLIRLHRSVPPLMNASESFNVHKKASSHLDETNICSDVRTVHAFGPFPKWLYRHLYSSGKDSGCAPHFAFGAVKGRRREEAIASQCILMERCHTRGLSTMMRLYDVRNAFCSVDHDVFGECLTTRRHADFLS